MKLSRMEKISNVVETPETGKITSYGWISPEGNTYPIGNLHHSVWIIKYKDWLKSKYNYDFNLKQYNGVFSDRLRDDFLKNTDWTRVAIEKNVVSFMTRNARRELKNILEALSFGMVEARPRVHIFDETKGDIEYDFRFDEVEKQLALSKLKANIILSSRDSIPNPWKKNYDYGEIPNFVDRIRWFLKKHQKRKAKLDIIKGERK